MGRSLLWIVGISGIALVVILCIRIFGDSSTAYNRAMSDCISSHTQDKETLNLKWLELGSAKDDDIAAAIRELDAQFASK